MEQLIQQVLETHHDKVKYVIKNYPIRSHRFAFKAAMAALAAGNQGKYWQFHRDLLQNYRSLNDEKINAIAEALELDMARFRQDLDSPQSRAIILEDINHGRSVGVSGTPTLFLNGRRIPNRELGNLSQMIADELTGD